jgi:hypothetical protein
MSGEAWPLHLQWNNVQQDVETALFTRPPYALELSAKLPAVVPDYEHLLKTLVEDLSRTSGSLHIAL